MKLADLRTFTPLHWALIAAATACVLMAAGGIANGLGFRWDPLNLTERRADRAVAGERRAKVDVAARRIETAGAQDQTRKVERAAADRAAATEIVHRYAVRLEAEDHGSETFPIPAPDDGADLRGVFGELCDLQPAVCADARSAAASRNAGDGARGLPDPAAPG